MKKSMRSPLLGEFEWRGLIADVTSLGELDAHLTEAPRSTYCGFDPTADSLHVGSLLPLLALRRVQLAGHRPIVLIGGGTGLIGDPSGKVGERALNPEDQVAEWADRLKRQVERFFDFHVGPHAAILADNYEWLSKLEVIPFLRDIGKHFSVGSMLARESVRARMGRADAGISYTEFSYQVLQAFDFLSLFRKHRCTVQLGGSDQWGNITAGTDLIRRIEGATAFGLTLPLVTKADGTKFGKTESGTVWLDPMRTSPYEMYQFWLNTADADVVGFLKYFTFLGREEIESLEAGVREHPEKRQAQRVLAGQATTLVHGNVAARQAEGTSIALRSGDTHSLTPGGDGGAVPGAVLPAEAPPRPLWRVMKEAGLVPSTSEARRLIQQGGVEVNRRRILDANEVLPPGKYTIQLGKRRVFRVIIEGAGGGG
jgi:tyrosyl-tRNA synthetase